MTFLEETFSDLSSSIPLIVTVAAVLAVLLLANWMLRERLAARKGGGQFGFQMTMLALTFVGLVAVLLALPVTPETRRQILGLLGLALTAVIAMSSTTFFANAMAGIMLRAVGNFRSGDFIRVDEIFGRVTERRLFHTEIQTEDRDLTTLPNYYLISKPVKVVRSSGTIVSAKVSLSYDVPQDRIRSLLLDAATASELQEPFVQVLDLGDFSVTYRIAGFLPKVKELLSARSRLRSAMLDALHAGDVEIVSPSFMIQRPQTPVDRVMPPDRARVTADREPGPESLIFDKADKVARLEALREERGSVKAKIEELEGEMKSASDATRADLDAPLRATRHRLEWIDAEIERRTAEINDDSI